MIVDLIFILLMALIILPAIVVVWSPNIVHAGFSLLFTLFGVAGLYAYMGADFLAVTQLMVYIGGVLVLVLFTVMMTRLPEGKRGKVSLERIVPAGVFSIGVFAMLYAAITGTEWGGQMNESLPTIAAIGTNFMTNYIFPFEYVSLVLLATMIGAALLIREKISSPDGNDETTLEQDQEVQS